MIEYKTTTFAYERLVYDLNKLAAEGWEFVDWVDEKWIDAMSKHRRALLKKVAVFADA